MTKLLLEKLKESAFDTYQFLWSELCQEEQTSYVLQLTLFEPGRADYPHLLLLAPPKFFTFRQHCTYLYNRMEIMYLEIPLQDSRGSRQFVTHSTV